MVWDLSATLWFFFNFIFLSSTICLGAGKFSVNITLNGTWANGFAQMNWHQESYPAAPCVTVVSPKLWELAIINDQTRCLWNKSGVDRKDVTTCNTGLIFPSKKLVFLKTNSLQQEFICLKRVLQRKEQESIKPFLPQILQNYLGTFIEIWPPKWILWDVQIPMLVCWSYCRLLNMTIRL